jgi:glyoxylase-like metal-dependent hydrolase (beta-lactamase superfamily II)
MNRLFSLFPLLCIYLCLGTGPASAGTNYAVQKVADGVYAAIAQPKGKAASNAMIVVTNSQVILAGAHFVPECIEELSAEITKITPIPLRYVILTHHHRGFNYIDYDFPENVEIITSWQTWQALNAGSRELKNPVTFFDKGLSLRRGKMTIVLNNTDLGHSEGDVIVYLAEEKVLFTSDLFYNEEVGFMGDGFMREWVLNLEMLEGIDARTVIPGLGKVTNSEAMLQFRLIFKDFLTEVLRHVEKGETLAQTKKGFHLPEYEALNGYRAFSNSNIERAFKQLKEN